MNPLFCIGIEPAPEAPASEVVRWYAIITVEIFR